jgi:hypothetical protein
VLALFLASLQPSSRKAHFIEQFTESWTSRWSPSEAIKEQKDGEVFAYGKFRCTRTSSRAVSLIQMRGHEVGKWHVKTPDVYPGIEGDEGLVASSKAAQHAISAPFETSLDPSAKTLVVQYEVKLQKGLDCGGAYVKVIPAFLLLRPSNFC